MVIITIGADGKPSERKLTISNKFENIDEILEFKLPANFETYNKYLIGVLEEEPNNRVAILPVLDNRVAISSMISYHPGKWQLYLMAREMKIDLDKPKIDISAKNNEHVFISDPIMGIVRDNLLNKEQIENAPLDSNLQIVYDEIMALITQVRTDLENGNYDGISPIVSFNKVQNGNEMSVTDRDGTKKILIKDGKNYEHSEEFNQLAEQVRQDKLSADVSAKKAQESMNTTGVIKGQVETLKASIDKTALDIASKSEDVTNKHTQVTQAAQQVETNKVAVQDLAKQVQTNADSANASKESASLSAQTASTKAQESLTSATNAKASETASAKAQESAEASAGIATTKAQEALKSAQDAAQHNANASTSSAEATKAAAQAQASASSASQSEANAKASETASATSASNAKASEMASKTSETNAHLSEEAALTSKNAAKASENIATAKATEASKSATQALESKNAASTSATQASNSAQAAKTSETSATQSKNSAAESATAAKTSEDNAKISETKAAASEANAKQSELNAKASETASKESETNAKASETVASTKASEASTSAQTASQKATIAETSANKAKASETNAKTSETNASKSAAAAKASETATGQVVADATAQANRAKTEADRAKTNADTVASSSQKIDKNASDITQLKQDLIVHMKMNRTGKLYGVKKWKSNINPTSSCDKLYDNVGLVCEPSTDTVEGRDDYEDINIFKWKRVNYKRYDDGFAYPIAFEGDEDFNNVDNADVGNIYQTFYYNEIDKGDYTELIISDTPNHLLGLKPWEEAVRADGTVMPYYIMSAYDTSLGSDGLLRSLPNRVIEANMSHNRMISEFQKKGKGYWGAGSNRMTFAQIFSQIKYGAKDIQSVMAGCTGYSSQLKATIQSSNKANTFPILKSQASLIEIGSRVSVGYGRVDSGNKINLDRGIATIHAYANQVKVLKIEDAGDGTNSLVYLDCDPFNTMPIDHSESGLKLDITLSMMPWHSGSTDAVIKHHDGSLRSNSNSRMPCRIQGIEYFCGKYIIASDTVIFNQPDTSKEVYFAPRGIKHTNNDSLIKQTYTKIGKIPPAKAGNGADYWVGDVEINHGAWFPSAGLATQNSYKDRLYFGGNATSGPREYLQGGYLGYGSYAGLACLRLWSWLDWAYWSFACAD